MLTGKWHADRFIEDPRKVASACAECGKPMWLPLSKVQAYRRCGEDCNAAYRAKTRESRKRPCEACGKDIFPRQTQLANGKGKFCSNRCTAAGLGLVRPGNPREEMLRLRREQATGLVTPFDDCPATAEWRLVASNPNYEVSEYGHLRRATACSNSKKGRPVKPGWHDYGYAKYTLHDEDAEKHWTAHRLVAVAFLGSPPPGKPWALHWDGIPLNCHFSNLRWGSSADNSNDRDRHGHVPRGDNHPCRLKPETRPRGEAHSMSKLTEHQVRMIRASSESASVLARRFGVDSALIPRIRQRLIWKHVQ